MNSTFSESSFRQQKNPRYGTFADMLTRYVRERRGGDAPSVYTDARIDRRTYSSIVSNPQRAVSKRTAIQFAIALRLNLEESDGLLRAAGYAFSPGILEDRLFVSVIVAEEYDFFKINERLIENGLKVIG